MRFLLCFFFIISIFALSGPTSFASADQKLWAGLITQLNKAGIERSYLEAVYSNKVVRFEPRTMPKKLLHRERPYDYKKFLSPERIKRAEAFLEKNWRLLKAIEQEYGVPSTVKTAILLVETDLGRYTGTYRIVNILSSMAISNDIELIAPWLPEEVAKDPKALAYFKKKAAQKSRWAFRELKAFFDYCRENGFDPVDIKGSPFGAFGLCQFMPTSVLRFGVDHDGDGRIDLFSWEDALASMANYLVKNGWHRGLTDKEAFRCILTYNRSRPYAKTILEVASILEKKEQNGP